MKAFSIEKVVEVELLGIEVRRASAPASFAAAARSMTVKIRVGLSSPPTVT
jgi:hypothetical protein